MSDTRDEKPGLVVVHNVPTPYGVHLIGRMASEIPELSVHAAYTRDVTDFSWTVSHPPNVAVHRLGTGQEWVRQALMRHPWRELRKARAVLTLAAAAHARAVLVNGWDSLSLIAVILRGSAQRPVLLRGDSNVRTQGSRNPLVRMGKSLLIPTLFGRAAALLPMGRLGQAYFERYGARADRCYWVPYEPPYHLFETVEQGAIEDARAQCGLSPDRRRALFVGRLVPEKRLDLLLAAFSEVAAPLREWDLVIAGEGPLRAVLERSVPPLIRHRVKWLGFIEHGHLPPVYRACHLVVLPSDHEPWGVVVNEALASGLPVIASDVVGAAFELVRTGENGWIFPAGQTSALTRALAVTCGASAQFTTGAREGAALAAWRVRADPIAGLRRALTAVGAL